MGYPITEKVALLVLDSASHQTMLHLLSGYGQVHMGTILCRLLELLEADSTILGLKKGILECMISHF